VPRAPVDAPLGVELGSVGLATGEARAALGAPFGELLVGLAGLAARLPALGSAGGAAVRPEQCLLPAPVGVALPAHFDETIPQTVHQFRPLARLPGPFAGALRTTLAPPEDREQARDPTDARGALVRDIVE